MELEGLEGLEDGGHEGEFDDGAGGGTAIGAMRRYAMLSSRRSLGLCLCSLAVSLPLPLRSVLDVEEQTGAGGAIASSVSDLHRARHREEKAGLQSRATRRRRDR